MPITDRDLAIDAAEAGAAVVRSHYGSSLTRFDKTGGDFATTADLDAEKAILGDFADVGVGYAVAEKGTPYWCLLFASPPK